MTTRDPLAGVTAEEITAGLLLLGPDDEVAIRNTQGGCLQYVITKVEGLNLRAGRFYTKHPAGNGGTAWYRKTGKNCFHPTGQSRVVPVNDAIRAYVEQFPKGTFGVKLEAALPQSAKPAGLVGFQLT